MPTLAKVPEFLRLQNFNNPEGTATGPLQLAEQIDEPIWTCLPRHPEKLGACHTYMESNRGARPGWLQWLPVAERLLEGAQSDGVLLVDVAGGRGHGLVDFAAKFPDAPGRLILEFLLHILDASARIYYMKFVLHDWSDRENQKILTELSGVLKLGYSKLIIEGFVLADHDAAMFPAMWDGEMMIFCNSMVDSQSQWTRLLDAAGFQVIKFWAPPGDGQSIIEAELEK
ncbi:hypothetical protein N7467_001714 [Penicillium canescens]|nr:hypothetical protein N7467_001714 [Penicillium canescens]